MVGLEPGRVEEVEEEAWAWVWPTLMVEPCCCSCLGNWAMICVGEPAMVLGEGRRADATFTPAEAEPGGTRGGRRVLLFCVRGYVLRPGHTTTTP